MNVYYFDQTAQPTSFPLDDVLAALRANDIEHDASQIVEDLNIKGWHIHKGNSSLILTAETPAASAFCRAHGQATTIE
jgi:hypothetical protein